jgi:hypothetical protein
MCPNFTYAIPATYISYLASEALCTCVGKYILCFLSPEEHPMYFRHIHGHSEFLL